MNSTPEIPPLLPFEDALFNFKGLLKKKRSPPVVMGVLIHLTVALELVMARRLYWDAGAGPEVMGEMAATVLSLLIAQLFICAVTSRVGAFFGKKARVLPTLPFLQVAMLPLLVILPAALLFRTSAASPLLMILTGFLLGGRVIHRWRETLQSAYRMTQFQSGVSMTAASLALFFGVISLVYATFLSKALAFI